MNNIIDWQDQYGDLETGFTVARGPSPLSDRAAMPAVYRIYTRHAESKCDTLLHCNLETRTSEGGLS